MKSNKIIVVFNKNLTINTFIFFVDGKFSFEAINPTQKSELLKMQQLLNTYIIHRTHEILDQKNYRSVIVSEPLKRNDVHYLLAVCQKIRRHGFRARLIDACLKNLLLTVAERVVIPVERKRLLAFLVNHDSDSAIELAGLLDQLQPLLKTIRQNRMDLLQYIKQKSHFFTKQ